MTLSDSVAFYRLTSAKIRRIFRPAKDSAEKLYIIYKLAAIVTPNRAIVTPQSGHRNRQSGHRNRQSGHDGPPIGHRNRKISPPRISPLGECMAGRRLLMCTIMGLSPEFRGALPDKDQGIRRIAHPLILERAGQAVQAVNVAAQRQHAGALL